VAYTKVPFFAAGIALGPLIKSSISFAQNALNIRKNVSNATQTNEGEEDEEDDPLTP
jgi:hypothetical protein